jgi:tRNA A37 threonylcarbamoyltransferase TsaD
VQFDMPTTSSLCLLFEVAAAEHLQQKLAKALVQHPVTDVLLGGGVVNNQYIRSQLRRVCKTHGAKLHFPYSRKLFVDNAAMIGVAASTKLNQLNNYQAVELDRLPNWSITAL